MTTTAERLALPVPHRMSGLPRNKAGYVVPWFVANIDGEWDFRVIRADGILRAVEDGLCFLCGKVRGRFSTFAIGPMCAINRVSAEPPSHLECAEYAAKVCPFLTNPKMVRRENGKPEDVTVAGDMIARNPGVTLLWTTNLWYVDSDGRGGALFRMGPPTSVDWYAEGRDATRSEVLASIDSGLPILQEACDSEDTPAGRASAHAALNRATIAALALVPKEQQA